MRVGVIGYGYWGPNLVRNLAETPNAEIIAVADVRQDRLDLVHRRYPAVEITNDIRRVIRHPNIDAVAIATPVSTHYPLAMEALEAGKHVLIEKPMTATSDEALRLIEAADKRNLVLMVDHTFVFTGAVRKVRQLIEDGNLGDIYYYDSTRINLGLFQQDIDVIWDLAVHDIAIMDYILPESPVEVSATGICHMNGVAEDTAYVTAFYDGPMISHVNVNWLSPVKVRRTLIGGSKRMIVYDDIENSEKIKVYDKGVNFKNGLQTEFLNFPVSYRSGDMHAPQIDMTEALRLVAQHFTDCVLHGDTPLTDGHAGLRVVSVLEAATRSMKNRGASQRLKPVQRRTVSVAAAAAATPTPATPGRTYASPVR
jgi:predicted dehydrogenase